MYTREAWEKEFLRVADYEIPSIQAVGSKEELGHGFTSADDLIEIDIGSVTGQGLLLLVLS